MCLCLGLAAIQLLVTRERGRVARVMGLALVLVAAGCLLPWVKSTILATPMLARTAIVTTDVRVGGVERLRARGMIRLLVAPQHRPDLPKRIRVNLDHKDAPADGAIERGDGLRLRVRLMPPAPAALPGGYDFARRAYFEGIGATGVCYRL